MYPREGKCRKCQLVANQLTHMENVDLPTNHMENVDLDQEMPLVSREN